VAGRISSIEKSSDIGNRILDLPACSIVPQTTTLLRAPFNDGRWVKLLLAVASAVILGSGSHGTHDHIRPSHDSGSFATTPI
jgi:hypothetical protein